MLSPRVTAIDPDKRYEWLDGVRLQSNVSYLGLKLRDTFHLSKVKLAPQPRTLTGAFLPVPAAGAACGGTISPEGSLRENRRHTGPP